MRNILLFMGMLLGSRLWAHGIPEESKQAMISGGSLEYLWLGAEHMLTGYDHLLFIFGVIFFLYRFKDVVKFITIFTLGHSITLLFATLMGITANYFLVDAVIALTVVYKGFDNLDGFRKYLKVKPPNMLFLVFCFGLIHGFGLSTRLQQLPLGEEGLILKILSFNVGVEIGQVVALTAMLLLLTGWRKTSFFERFSKAANIALIAAGFYLFYVQMHGYTHQHEEQHHADEVQVIESGEPQVQEHSHEEEAQQEEEARSHDHGDGHKHHH